MLSLFPHSISLSLLGIALLAAATPLVHLPRAAPALRWGACPSYNATALTTSPFPVVCANFTVPFDWNTTTAKDNPGSFVLTVGKIAATTNQSLGMIFVNPGGPGGSGVTLLLAPQILGLYNSTGGAFDIVSWDPRGVGFSAPFDCFDDSSTAPGPFTFTSWYANLTNVGSLQAPSSGPNQTDIDRFNANANAFTRVAQPFYGHCQYTNNSAYLAGHVGAVATMRDLVALADAIDGTGKPINYYGYSYGSVIGAYFVNLYPQRVGRVVVDGVENATEYTSSTTPKIFASSYSDADATLQGFLRECAESGPSGCALATTNSTQGSLSDWISQLIDDAYNYASSNSTVNSLSIREFLGNLVENPTSWNASAGQLVQIRQALTAAMTGATPGGNTTTTTRRSQILPRAVTIGRPSSFQTGEQAQGNAFSAAVAVSCGDSILPMYSASEVFSDVANTTLTM
ncbi:hypothetical protein FRB94_007179 [Tulasnella sp. JGI-2019a]|nr:hypothetical protein FRB94_007179 [Tulasnella sp. JGI-2019a]